MLDERPRLWQPLADAFARRIEVLLAQCPVNRDVVIAAVNDFHRSIKDFEANGNGLFEMGFEPVLAGILERNWICTDRQLSRLTIDQIAKLRGSSRFYAKHIIKEMKRLNIKSLAFNIKAVGPQDWSRRKPRKNATKRAETTSQNVPQSASMKRSKSKR